MASTNIKIRKKAIYKKVKLLFNKIVVKKSYKTPFGNSGIGVNLLYEYSL